MGFCITSFFLQIYSISAVPHLVSQEYLLTRLNRCGILPTQGHYSVHILSDISTAFDTVDLSFLNMLPLAFLDTMSSGFLAHSLAFILSLFEALFTFYLYFKCCFPGIWSQDSSLLMLFTFQVTSLPTHDFSYLCTHL